MLLDFLDKGHLRAQSITEDENGAKVRMVTDWHGHWEIKDNELHVGFRWKYPSDIWVHRRLQWLGNGMWRHASAAKSPRDPITIEEYKKE